MGAIRKRTSGRYEARWYDQDGRQHSQVFAKHEDARAHIRSMEGKKVRGESANPKLGRKLFRDVAEEWLTDHIGIKPRTAQGYRQVLNAYLLPRFGDMAISKITPAMVRNFRAKVQGIELGEELSVTTRNNIMRTLSPIMRYALANEYIGRNPLAGMGALKKDTAKEIRALSPEEIDRLADAMPPPWGVYIYAAAYTGARSGELTALKVGDLDILRRRITIRRSLADVAGRLVFGLPKNNDRKGRTFTIPPSLADMLAAYLVGRDTSPEALVFTAPKGGPLRHNDWMRKVFRPAAARAFADDRELQRVRFHDLRHSCASILIAAGESPVSVAQQLGHAKPSITLNVYSHWFEAKDDERAGKLEAVIRSAAAAREGRAHG